MFSTLILQSLHVALLGLTFATRVHGSMNYVPNDIVCPEDSHAGFVHNTYTYIAPLEAFTNITKSFFDIKWYADTNVTNTTGTDNVPGATRSGLSGGGVFNETLMMYSMHHDSLVYTFHGQAVTYSLPNQNPLHFDGYAETMRLKSICNGQATYIDFITYLCSNESTAAYDVWYTAHMFALQEVTAGLGAKI
ncbi:hypothetical protein MVEN_00959300 [Mycena venus]|uniref:Uncharacterized protein n=1 Tax=Mycena venus TaxID=2733690 RepID=A0A8H7CZS8_9AGAR|nr:hypothetical protein MVEN_00959300 [Mycena venus]